jgi:excisionase family DNA binding protein
MSNRLTTYNSYYGVGKLEASMKIHFDKVAVAFCLILHEGHISKDMEVAHNVFADFDRSGRLIEIQILEVFYIEEPWMSLEAAAKYLHKSKRTLLRRIKDGKISPKKVGREYRIKPQELKKLVS